MFKVGNLTLQGLLVVVDDSNGFAGIATDLLESVVDDYDKSPVLLFTARSPTSLLKPTTSNSSTLRGLHDVLSFSQLSSSTQCIIPLGLSSFSKCKPNMSLSLVGQTLFHASSSLCMEN